MHSLSKPFTLKYAPKKLEEIIGNDEVKEKVRTWILNWLRGNKQKPLLIYGPPGTGKTSMAYALAKEYNLEIIELSASDFRDKRRIDRIIKSSFLAKTLSGKQKIILVDDVDAMTSKDRGGISELAKLLQNPVYPVILTANDGWDPKLSPIRINTVMLQMKKVSPIKIMNLLKKIAKKEGIEIDERTLEEIAKNADGDVRSAINDLEARFYGVRDRKAEIFEILKLIFKSMKLNASRVALAKSDIDNEMLMLWIEENIPNEYERADEIATAYNYISKADVFMGRIKNRQYWGFLRYALLLMTAGVGLAKHNVYRKFTKYKFPSLLLSLSRTKQKREKLKEIAKKIASKIHTSSKEVYGNFSFYAELIKKDKERAKIFYRLSEEDLKFIEGLNNGHN